VKIGITGHQERPGIDWEWVRLELDAELAAAKRPLQGLSSLAKGADQVFAKAVLEHGGHLISVIPIDEYERYFEGEALATYRELLQHSTVTNLHGNADDEEAFLRAGIFIADHCDLLIAVWDGQPSQGKGGTADVVMHAHKNQKAWLHIEPTTKATIRYPGAA
jgi:hypothetical protein